MAGLGACVLGALLGTFTVACGGNSAASTARNASIPAISNLTANFSTGGCIRAADGLAGRALVITFGYTDTSGATSGGRVQLSRVYNTGRSETHFFVVPSEVTSSTETLTLFDAT